MSRRRNDVFSEAVVGLFMLIVLALLIYFTVVISGVDVFTGGSRVRVRAVFSQVGGLKDHDNVMYRGTKVGVVERVAVTPTNLVVHMSVDGSVVLRTGYRIAVCNLSMLGGNYLSLDEGAGEPLDLATTLFRGEAPSDWMRDVSNVTRKLSDFAENVDFRPTISNLEAISAKTLAVVDRVERGEGILGKMMSGDDTLYNDLRSVMTNADATVRSAKEVVSRVQNGEGILGRLISIEDSPTLDDLKAGIAAFRKACESVDVSGINNIGGNVSNIVAEAKTLLANLNAVSEKMKAGEGTIGKLANDPEMYDEVNGLIKDVRQVIDNYRDTTPISTFGSLIMGGL